MNREEYDITAGRQWCIETAIEACGGESPAMPNLAAQLIALLETGRPAPDCEPADRPLDFQSIRVGGPMPNECAVAFEGMADGFGDALRERVAGDTDRPDPEPPPEPTTWIDKESPPLPARSVPRIPPAATPAAVSNLSDKDHAVLAAVTRLSAGDNGWPTHAQIAEASDVPRGSLGYVLERLRDKGHLARVDGKWALAEPAAERGAVA